MPKVGDDGNPLWKDEHISKYFGVAEYGDFDKAFQAARVFRNRYLTANGLTRLLNSKRNCSEKYQNSIRNTSGIIGVSVSIEYRGSEVYMYWVSNWREKGTTHRKAFSANKLGECQAFQLACRHRFEHKGELVVLSKNHWPCEPGVPYEVVEQDLNLQ